MLTQLNGLLSDFQIATNGTSQRQTGGMPGSRRVLKKDSSSALVTQV